MPQPQQLKDELLRLLQSYALSDLTEGLAELCDDDGDRYERERDESGIVESCRADAEALREAADQTRR